MSAFIPFSRPSLGINEIQEVVDSLNSGWITTGPKVAKFEQLICKRLDVPNAVATSSGTAAWQLLAHCLGVGPGDEVILPSITWPSMANVVELLGAKTVFADVDDCLIMQPSELERLISPATKVVMPVHYAGASAYMDAYRRIIGNRPIHLVEDAAHAIGAEYCNRQIGCDSDAVIFSFHANKNLTTGEGGMLISKDEDLMQRAKSLSQCGVGRNAWERMNDSNASYQLEEPGYKCNMMDIQAAIGIHQLAKLDTLIEKRRVLAERYNDAVFSIPGITAIAQPEHCTKHAWHIYVVKLDTQKTGLTRAEFITKLREENIGVGVHFEACHQLAYYQKKYSYQKHDLPNATALGSSILSLPLHPGLTFDEQDQVIEAIRNILTTTA